MYSGVACIFIIITGTIIPIWNNTWGELNRVVLGLQQEGSIRVSR